jgi:hypothetical protein
LGKLQKSSARCCAESFARNRRYSSSKVSDFIRISIVQTHRKQQPFGCKFAQIHIGVVDGILESDNWGQIVERYAAGFYHDASQGAEGSVRNSRHDAHCPL